MAFKQLKFVVYCFKLEMHFRFIHFFLFCRKQERKMARHLTIITNEQTSFFEEGEFIDTAIIDQLYLRKFKCLRTKISIEKRIFNIFIRINASVKKANKIWCFKSSGFEVFNIHLISWNKLAISAEYFADKLQRASEFIVSCFIKHIFHFVFNLGYTKSAKTKSDSIFHIWVSPVIWPV